MAESARNTEQNDNGIGGDRGDVDEEDELEYL